MTITVTVFLVLAVLSPICHSASEGVDITGTPAGWSDDIRLTYASPDSDKYAAISVWESQVHITWRKLLADRSEIYYINSTNSGQSWSNPIQLSEGVSGIYCMYPDIDVDSNIHVVWNDNEAIGFAEIKYCNSSDGGITWSATKMISVDDGENSEAPLITVSGSTIHVVWIDSRFYVSPNWNREIYYVRSVDGGITWDDGLGNIGQERRLTNAIYGSGPNGIVTNGSNIHMVFSDDRESPGTCNVFYKRSVDNGITWDDGLGNIDQDRKLTTNGINHGPGAIAVNGSHIHVVWVDEVWPGPDYYIYYRNSTDNGATWGTTKLLTGPTVYADEPDLAVYEDDIHLTWMDERDDGSTTEVYYKNSTDGGITWSSDIRLTYNESFDSLWPRIALNESTAHVTWFDRRDSNREIYYKRYPDFPPDPTFNITLDEGWNLISLPLEQRDESITEVLSSIDGKWDYLQAYDPLAPEPWKTYATFKPSQLNELQFLNHKMGFWINITEPNVNLTVSGPIPTSTSINLYAGWNLVGYPSLVNETVANALWGTGADKVEVCDPAEPYRIREVGPSYVMKPGEGYWIHVPADTVWVVDW